MPIASGKPICTGAPCATGSRDVICTARTASAGLSGRIDTTSGPWNRPAGVVGTFVRYMETLQPRAMWRIGMPAAMSGSSNENEQPITKPHEVIAPGCANVGRLVRQLTVPPDPIAPEIGTDIKVGRKRRQSRIAGLGNADERTRLRIGDAEPQELICPVARQDGEIALHEAGREPRSRAVEAAGPAGEPDIAAGLQPTMACRCGITGKHLATPGPTPSS